MDETPLNFDPMPEPQPVHLSMGGNIGDVREAFRLALRALDRGVSGELWVSRLYRAAPWGDTNQPEYLNLVVELTWNLDPNTLLGWTRRLENEAGRVRAAEKRWGPRPLDIDILLAGSIVRDGALLSLPHPRLHERRFVLLPLLDLLPAEYSVPRYEKTLGELLANCPDDSAVEPISDGPWDDWRA